MGRAQKEMQLHHCITYPRCVPNLVLIGAVVWEKFSGEDFLNSKKGENCVEI
jgi:hypothetical protein